MTTPATNGVPQPTAVKPNGATPPPNGAPPAVAAQPPPEAPKPPEADPRLKELETQTKRFAAQQRKFAEDRQAFEKRRAEETAKQKEYEEWKQYHADRLRNPAKYLAKDYGEDWYDKLTSVKFNGGAPTGDLLASDLDSRLSDFEKKLQADRAEVDKRFQQLQTQEAERTKEAFHQEVISEVRKNLTNFPSIGAFSDDPSVWTSITGEIDAHFSQNRQAILNGEMEMLTAEEAASRVDKRIEAIGRKFEEAQQKRQSAATQPEQQKTQRSDTPQRRTLSTDMTASSGTEYVPPKDDRERLERAKAAWERVKQQRQ